MWTRDNVDLPPDLASVTTSVWSYANLIQVGVMRNNFLAPPILWAQTKDVTLRGLRDGKKILDELQQLIYAPVVQAEATKDSVRNQRFLLFLGFQEVPLDYDRKLYTRSI